MPSHNYRLLASSLLAAAFIVLAFNRDLAAEEYVWARFYGSNPPTGYATNGFGSFYVPKSMVSSGKLQTDPIKKPAEPKPAEEPSAETKTTNAAADSQAEKPAAPAKKSFWKRITFRK